MTCGMHDVKWAKKRTVEPTGSPVTLDEVKSQLRILHEDEDALIRSYIDAATYQAELICDRQLLQATYVLKMDAFPDEIRLPMPPCISVTSIAYVDTSGTTQTLSASNYLVDTSHEPGRIVPVYGGVWPIVRGMPNDVTVTYEAGYASASAIPKNIKLGIIHLIAHWYENREPVNIGNIVNPLPWMCEELIRSAWHGYVW